MIFKEEKLQFLMRGNQEDQKKSKKKLTENLTTIVKKERRINTRELSTRLNISKSLCTLFGLHWVLENSSHVFFPKLLTAVM